MATHSSTLAWKILWMEEPGRLQSMGRRSNYGEDNEIVATSFQRSHVGTVTLSAPSPAAGHCWPTLPLATPGYSWASLVQSLVGHCCFFWVLVNTRFCLCPPRVYFPHLLSSSSSVVGLMATSSKRAYAIPMSAVPRGPVAAAVHCWPPQETLKHSFVSVSVGSLGPGVHKLCLSPLSISGGNGIWF